MEAAAGTLLPEDQTGAFTIEMVSMETYQKWSLYVEMTK